MVVVALGEPGVPVICWALAVTTASRQNTEDTDSASRSRPWPGLSKHSRVFSFEICFEWRRKAPLTRSTSNKTKPDPRCQEPKVGPVLSQLQLDLGTI